MHCVLFIEPILIYNGLWIEVSWIDMIWVPYTNYMYAKLVLDAVPAKKKNKCFFSWPVYIWKKVQIQPWRGWNLTWSRIQSTAQYYDDFITIAYRNHNNTFSSKCTVDLITWPDQAIRPWGMQNHFIYTYSTKNVHRSAFTVLETNSHSRSWFCFHAYDSRRLTQR